MKWTGSRIKGTTGATKGGPVGSGGNFLVIVVIQPQLYHIPFSCLYARKDINGVAFMCNSFSLATGRSVIVGGPTGAGEWRGRVAGGAGPGAGAAGWVARPGQAWSGEWR